MGPRAKAVCSLFILLQVLAEPAENSDFYLPGDYLLGGLFTLHANVKGTVHLSFLQVPQCKKYEMKVLGYNLMQAMRFAVEEINNRSDLLPGVLLGYEIVDVCYISNNVQPVLYFLAREDYSLPIQEDYSHYVPRVLAVIGPDNSESTTTVAHFLSLFLLPQITYSAISDDLRDKQHFPALLRTVAGADHQIEAMVQLLLHFNWNWIIVLVSSDDYGRYNSQLLNDRLATGDICIAFQETLPMPQPDQVVTEWERQRLEAIVGKLQQSSARVVVLFSPDLILHNFFREVLRQNFTGAVWIASESWAIDPVLHNLTELRQTGTFLGVTTQSVPIPGFSEFRIRRTPVRLPEPNRTSLEATCNQECDTCQDTTASFNSILMLSGERVVYNVYSAVYAVAHALHSLLGCTQACSKEVVYPWQLLKEIWKVNFTLLGHNVFFGQQGDVLMPMEVIQWQWDLSQNPFQSIASYYPKLRQLKAIHNISWHTANNTIPVSMCSKDCHPGQRKKPVGIHSCCFECIDCLPGTFLNRTADEFDCQPCPSYEWSHRNDTSCFKRRLAFLEWHEPSTIFVVMLTILGFLSTLAIMVIFWRHLHTPVVRSAGGPMCFLMLVPLLLAYAMVPMYIGQPTFFSCLWRQTFFTLCFTICISCITVRSFQIVCIFKMARRLPRAYGYWVRCHGPYVFVASFMVLKVVIVAGNVLATTANPTARPDPDDPNIMVLSCNYRRALLFNTSLDLLLSVAGFSFAYMGKELPTNYNEAKFITLCMTFYFTSSVSLCTFMSVYDGVLVTILDLLITVLNLLGISFGYFGPKCYMVLFYPERNTQVYFSSMIQGYTMGKD
ncbi:taste receptor type 1 member 2 precursor [Canis lupus familiaris]|uniref:Taste receptor type 1 member 2 n=1 Tax=Canis lupus familiaris TaxID=9615 RepID=TS1R2_CANLF|nr:taste receptor type 1 member 2 precursor [Canis lupus familiaris]Q49HI0.1 RecName: Full=Taste receptor type 1 member 2; AltName: Full=Sweet taste receptor T1R2; Flags: Precursor [Canis lupus familiaris]AAX98691.1 taste receptor, type 1, member 2 [Canis lupus familiaris]|eukprot:NP_001026989.1 taste receptor type 1 member 2 precursor [Canis lupus familiaris]